jgi:hypothetical protein
MNNIMIKTGLHTLVFTVIAIGLFGISTISLVDDVFGEKDEQGKNSNTEGSTISDSSSNNNNNVKYNPLDPRGC